MRRVLATVALALLAGCATTLGVEDLDRLERSLEARTVALEPEYTLWSPFALDGTRGWVEMVDEELAAGRELLGARQEGRLMVVLVPLEGLGPQVDASGGQVRFSAPDAHPLHGLAGSAGGGQIVLYVTPDRALQGADGPLIAHRGASDYRRTLRHELAHVHAHAAGLEGERWFSEGLADLVESYALEDGRLVDRGPQEGVLRLARTFPPDECGVERLLDWREDGQRIAAGAEPVDRVARTLCGLFVRFLAGRQPDGSLPERLRGVGGLERSELLALEPAWGAWLSGALSGAGEGPLSGSGQEEAGKAPSSH